MPDHPNNEKLETVRRVYAFWGKFPSLYDAQDTITFLGRAEDIRSLAVKKMGLKKGDKVLEVACGSGRNFPYLIQAVGQGGKIVGFDYSQEMLDAAKKTCARNGWKNIELTRGDAAQLEITDDYFIGILSVLGISAIPDWKKALNRCNDVLLPGGRMVVCDAHLFTGFLRIFNPLVKFVYSTFAAWDPAKDIAEKMKEIFGNVEVHHFNFDTFFIAVSVKEKT